MIFFKLMKKLFWMGIVIALIVSLSHHVEAVDLDVENYWLEQGASENLSKKASLGTLTIEEEKYLFELENPIPPEGINESTGEPIKIELDQNDYEALFFFGILGMMVVLSLLFVAWLVLSGGNI